MGNNNELYPAKNAYKGNSILTYDSDRFSSIKGKIFNYLEKRSVIKLVNKYFDKGSYILDIPVGTGRIAEELLRKGYKVMGVDISKEMIELSKNKLNIFGKAFSYKIEDAENISFEDNYFEGVTSVRFFGHLPYIIKKKVLKKMLRVSKKGVFVTFYYNNIFQILKRKIKNVFKKNDAPWYPLKFNEIEQLIIDCGGIGIDKKYVLPLISEGITYYIKKNENPLN